MKKLPYFLLYSRLAISPVILFLAFFADSFPYSKILIVFLIIYGLLSDIFDGIAARKLKVSTEKIRRLDSSIDQVFWITVLISTSIISPVFFKTNFIKIVIVTSLETLAYAISFIRFRKEVATHAILSKIWALTLFATLLEIILSGSSPILFEVCFYLGIITRLEIISILITLKSWTNDIPSLYHAIQIRKGKEIKRNKLFNG